MRPLIVFLFATTVAFSAKAERTIPGFSISKDKNNNIIKYDVKIRDNCTFAAQNPIDIYWLIPKENGTKVRENLGFFETGYYTFEIKSKKASEISGQVRALENKNKEIDIRLVLVKKKDKCLVQAYGAGKLLPEELRLSSIRLEKFNGEVPHELAVIGKGVKSSHSVVFQIAL